MSEIIVDRFKDRIGVVVGGASGIARAIAKRFAAEGGISVVIDRDEENGKKVVEEIVAESGDGKAVFVYCDIADTDQIKDAVSSIVNEFGHIDHLFNMAAITLRKHMLDITPEEFDQVMNVNLRGQAFMTQAVVRDMIDKGIKGTVVYATSRDAHRASDHNPCYCISKSAILQLMRSNAIDFGKHGIRVNSLAPGFTITPFVAASVADPALYKQCTQSIPMGRAGEPEEQAAVALFLSSDDASYMNGADVNCDGGVLCPY